MSFDGIVMNSLIYELTNLLVNGKIEKVHQPENDEIILNIQKDGKITNYFSLQAVVTLEFILQVKQKQTQYPTDVLHAS